MVGPLFQAPDSAAALRRLDLFQPRPVVRQIYAIAIVVHTGWQQRRGRREVGLKFCKARMGIDACGWVGVLAVRGWMDSARILGEVEMRSRGSPACG